MNHPWGAFAENWDGSAAAAAIGQHNTHDKTPPHIKERRRAAGRMFVQLAAVGTLICVYVPIGLVIKTAGV